MSSLGVVEVDFAAFGLFGDTDIPSKDYSDACHDLVIISDVT